MELDRIYRISKDLAHLRIQTDIFPLIATDGISKNIMERVVSQSEYFFPLSELKNNLAMLSLSEDTMNDIDSILADFGISLRYYFENIADNDIKKFTDELSKASETKRGKQLEMTQKEITGKLVDKITAKPSASIKFTELIIGTCENISNKLPIWEDRILLGLKAKKVKELFVETQLNPSKLIKGAESFFNQHLWSKLDDLQKADLKDGCNCILTEAWTPAAMIIMRTIESCLRTYYKKIKGVDPTKKNWHDILTELRSETAVDKKLLNYFDYLKDFRNRLQHPEARFKQSEAEDVLSQAIHVINQINS